jgi:4-hydroxy-tetrahydrodipicolinate reductase
MVDSLDVRVIHYGLGQIGRMIARVVAERGSLRSVAAIDREPELVGLDLGDVIGGERSGIAVVAEPNQALGVEADVVLHSTVSRFIDAAPQLIACVKSGKRVVISTCEELAFPWKSQPDVAVELDDMARAAGAVVVSAGVNPGFAMDYLPVVLSGSMTDVRAVQVRRRQDIARRRSRLREKLGIGLTRVEFEDLLALGGVGHVGLTESGAAVASAFGWQLERLTETVSPVMSSGPDALVIGVSQRVEGFIDQRPVLQLSLELGVGVEESSDEVTLVGEPGLHAVIPGGVQGDAATAALAVNSIGPALSAAPGLRSALELAPPHPGPLRIR